MNTEQSIAKSNEDDPGRATHERERASEAKDATVHDLEVQPHPKAEPAAEAKAEPAAEAKAEPATLAKAEPAAEAKADVDGEHAPVSESELVADSVRDRELEPVSLRDIELILAPGKAPPPMARPAKAGGEPRAPAAPRKRLPSLPTAPLKKHHEPVARGEDSALDDLRALAGLNDDKGLEKKVDLAAIMEMGSTTGTDARLSHPEIPRESDLPPPPAPIAARGKPRPPLRSRPSISDEQEATGASVADGVVDITQPGESSGATQTRPKSIPPPLPAEATATKTPSKAAPSIRPSAKSSAPAATQSIEPRTSSSRTLWIVGAVALIAGGVGYFARGGGDPAAGAISTATAATTVVSQAPEARPTPTPAVATSKDDANAPVSTSIAGADAATTAPPASAALTGKLPTGAAATTAAATTTAATEPAAVAATTATATATATTTAEPTPPPAGAEFDKSAASAALGAAVGSASGCKQPGDPSGTARVQITFVPSGRVTTANIAGPPFAGTATGSCIARAFKSASVPPFSGDPVTVSKSVNIP
ncbi:MAG TPA: hypothetical protein VL400_07670 [Polyangiaceae bacterium]|nr:hypothetical protein [Polyangiaceae bacterium]